MFCKNCGCKIDDDATVCPYCHCSTTGDTPVYHANASSPSASSIVGFILSFVSGIFSAGGIVPLIALIVSASGHNTDKKQGRPTGIGIGGIVISAIFLCYSLIGLIVLGSFFGGFLISLIALGSFFG